MTQSNSDQSDYTPPDAGVPGPRVEKAPVQETEVTAKPAAETGEKLNTSLSKTLEALNQRITKESSSASLLADPEIRAYLDAKAQGKNPRLVAETAPVVEIPKIQRMDPKELDNLTNSQMVDYLERNLQTLINSGANKAASEQITSLREEIAPRLNAALSSAQQQNNRLVESEITSAKKEFKDFEEMRPMMVEMTNSGVKGLSIKELYIAAKIRSGQPIVSQKEIETERPSAQAGQRKAFQRVNTPLRGRGGFNALARAALDHDLGTDIDE